MKRESKQKAPILQR